MEWLYASLLMTYWLTAGAAYVCFAKARHLIGYHLGMNLAMTSSGVIGIATGIALGSLFPAHFAWITVLTTLLAILAGVSFGALVDYQTLITGVSSGIMAGLMGPMIGVMADEPLVLVLFSGGLLYLSFGMLCFSMRS